MLKPSVADLLVGVADGLATTVLPELPPGPARDQVQAAIGINRKVARALPQLTPYLVADIVDLAASLRRLHDEVGPGHGDVVGVADEALAAVDALPLGPVPSLDELATVNLQLRDAVAELCQRADLDPGQEEELRALLGRMTAREAALRLSPWER